VVVDDNTLEARRLWCASDGQRHRRMVHGQSQETHSALVQGHARGIASYQATELLLIQFSYTVFWLASPSSVLVVLSCGSPLAQSSHFLFLPGAFF
jgi:hypothetical protein